MGPTTPEDALAWAQQAMTNGRYIPDPHFLRRCQQRRVSRADFHHVIAKAQRCASYPDGTPRAEGTCWRLWGPDTEGEETTVGFEAFQDHLGRRILLLTVF